MFKNYCTIIFRNLWRNKLFTLVNIIGLGVGIASIVWGVQNYRYCFSYNDFHKDGKNIFRVLTKASGNDNRKGICPATLALAVKNDFPVVKGSTEMGQSRSECKSRPERAIRIAGTFYGSAVF